MRKLIASTLAAATLASGVVAAPAFAQSAPAQVVKAQYPYGYGNGPRSSNRYYDRKAGGWCYAGEPPGHCRQRLEYERRNHRRYYWNDGRYYYDDGYYRGGRYYRRDRHDDNDAAIIAGIIGFALGAAIVGSQDDRAYYERHRNDRRWQDDCRRRYDSFDPYSGTYLDRDGYRRYCRS
jgi:hypothetical protein